MYVNGLSTSLPAGVQLEMLRSVPGLEGVRMTRTGYAIEYDYYPPHQLHPTLECRALAGTLSRGADQRHHRVRGGGGAGSGRWRQRSTPCPADGSRWCWNGTRPSSEC